VTVKRNGSGYTGVRATVLGMARQGLALARFLLRAGARVTVSDQRTAGQLATAAHALEQFAQELGVPVPRFVLGGHPLTLLDDTDLLLLSGGVSPAIPIAEEARRRGIPLSNDGALTLRHCPAPVIGITGSAGKTTTTTLTGLILEAAGYRVHVGGNIGTPLIDRLDEIQRGDKVVMELSSFQLELMDRSPAIAAILNITPNHLDRHPSMSHYAAAKANILRFQERGDIAVLGADDRYTGPWLSSGRVHIDAGAGQEEVYFPLLATAEGFSLERELPVGGFLAGDRRAGERLMLRQPGRGDTVICSTRDVRLRGRHNLGNILAAACLSSAAGAPVEAMGAVATRFSGVEHRLEIVRERAGVTWVNDSIATAPERTLADIRAFAEPLVLLLGGRDKHLPWDECAREICAGQVRCVVLFGEAAPLIGSALEKAIADHGAGPAVNRVPELSAAVEVAAEAARPGDVVLLAPGGTSFDAYVDFAARGQHFRELVEALP
jgi:UDP-N-acetylmuramoylalanine--D-glutamate ligase